MPYKRSANEDIYKKYDPFEKSLEMDISQNGHVMD